MRPFSIPYTVVHLIPMLLVFLSLAGICWHDFNDLIRWQFAFTYVNEGVCYRHPPPSLSLYLFAVFLFFIFCPTIKQNGRLLIDKWLLIFHILKHPIPTVLPSWAFQVIPIDIFFRREFRMFVVFLVAFYNAINFLRCLLSRLPVISSTAVERSWIENQPIDTTRSWCESAREREIERQWKWVAVKLSHRINWNKVSPALAPIKTKIHFGTHSSTKHKLETTHAPLNTWACKHILYKFLVACLRAALSRSLVMFLISIFKLRKMVLNTWT